VGPLARLWRSSHCSLGIVCCLDWAHVHPRLHCQTPKVCYTVSPPALLATSQVRRADSPSACSEVTSERDAQWPILHSSSATAMRTHATLQGFLHASTQREMTISCRRMESTCHLTSLVSGRSTLHPLQRSCGLKVRRVPGCRRPCPHPTTQPSAAHLKRPLALTSLACTQMVHGQRPVFELLGRPDGAHPIP
jgi:hypothetical protein